jgi:DNA-binding XRE family transcriptional regulator
MKRLNAKIITTPKGERLAILPAEEYEDMSDALIHAQAMSDYREGRDESITLAEMRVLLDAPTPLAFWRAKRGMTQASLAEAAGLTGADIEAIESGSVAVAPEVMAKIAAVLRVRDDELLVGR